jgi:glycosyltransferase involved in cell wall biosynthesis
MKVLYFYLTSGQEGSRIHIESFVRAFAALGDDIVDAGAIVPAFREDKRQWSYLRRVVAKLQWLAWNVREFLRLHALARRHRPDVIVVRFMQDHRLFLPILSLSSRYPLVLEVNTLRSNEDPEHASPLIRVFDRWSLRRADRVFVVSKLLREQILQGHGLVPQQVAVVENGVDVEQFNNTVDPATAKDQLGLSGRFVIGFIGSFKPWHGLQHLLTLAKAMASEQWPLQFLVVGDGEERPGFERYVVTEALQHCVRFTGHVAHAEVPLYLSAMDVVVAPYSSDTFAAGGGFHGSPLKIFEYMAAAKAIIAAPIGQLNELIIDGESGLLIPSEDTVRLCNAVLSLYDNPSKRSRLGRNARQRVSEHYTWAMNATKVRRLCTEAIDLRAGQAGKAVTHPANDSSRFNG